MAVIFNAGTEKYLKRWRKDVSDVRATDHRYSDLSYLAGMKDTVGILVSLDMIKEMELGEGEDAEVIGILFLGIEKALMGDAHQSIYQYLMFWLAL